MAYRYAQGSSLGYKTFKVGQEVVLTENHKFQGKTLSRDVNRAATGDVGRIVTPSDDRTFDTPHAVVEIPGFPRRWYDESCLAPMEAALDEEARVLLGVKSKKEVLIEIISNTQPGKMLKSKAVEEIAEAIVKSWVSK